MTLREIYSYCSYAFRPEIPWFSAPEINIEVSGYLNVLNGSSVSSFQRTFWFSITVIIIYVFFAVSAIKSLKNGNLGEDENGRPAAFPSYKYFVVLGVQTIGGSFFQNIIKWLLDAFVCNFDQVSLLI